MRKILTNRNLRRRIGELNRRATALFAAAASIFGMLAITLWGSGGHLYEIQRWILLLVAALAAGSASFRYAAVVKQRELEARENPTADIAAAETIPATHHARTMEPPRVQFVPRYETAAEALAAQQALQRARETAAAMRAQAAQLLADAQAAADAAQRATAPAPAPAEAEPTPPQSAYAETAEQPIDAWK